jgi:hypothetical protein
MSFTARLIHTLEIWRPTFDESNVDDHGQPPVSYALIASPNGLVQPKSAREVALISQAGATIGLYTIHLEPTDLAESDRIDHVIGTGRQSYELTGIRRFDFGSFPHFEVDANRMSADSSVPDWVEGS